MNYENEPIVINKLIYTGTTIKDDVLQQFIQPIRQCTDMATLYRVVQKLRNIPFVKVKSTYIYLSEEDASSPLADQQSSLSRTHSSNSPSSHRVDRDPLHPSQTTGDLISPVMCDLAIEFEEEKRSTTIGFHSYSNFEFVTKGKIHAPNLLGRGEYLDMLLGLGKNTSIDGSINFTKPFFKNCKIDKNLKIESFLRTFKQTHYTETLSGVSSTFEFIPHHNLTYECLLRNIRLSRKATEGLLMEGGINTKSSVSHTYVQTFGDSVSSFFGRNKVKVTSEVAGLGGDARFGKVRVSVNGRKRLNSGDFEVCWNGTVGVHVPLGRRGYISDRFFWGGSVGDFYFGSFQNKGIGPRHHKDSFGGDLLAAFRAALCFPLPFSLDGEPLPLKCEIFAQMGNLTGFSGSGVPAWLRDPRIHNTSDFFKSFLRDMRFSVGSGFFVDIGGMGRLHASFGVPLWYKATDALCNFGIGFTMHMAG